MQLLRIRAQVSGRIAMNSMPCKAKSFPFFFPTQCLPKPLPHIFELSHILFKKIRNGDSVVKFHSIQRLCGQCDQPS